MSKSNTAHAGPSTALPLSTGYSLMRDKAYIAGRWCEAEGGGRFEVTDPSNREVLGDVPDMGASDTRAAIDAAQEAFGPWASRTAKERCAIVRRWFDLMVKHEDKLASLLTLEQGKPLPEALSEVRYAASFVEWFAEEGKRTYGDTIPSPLRDRRILVIKQPIGVVAAITPWNFPSSMITRKCAPAIAAGCTVVVKPAEQTPYSALALAALAEEAGVPPGVFNIVIGRDPAPIAHELTQSPVVRKLSFTGSTEVGKLLYAQCAGTMKRLTLELGGNAPFIVFEDADLDAAVVGAMTAKFRASGQSCVAANRLLVHDKVRAEFTERLASRIARLRVGNGFTAEVDIGPLIEERAVERLEHAVRESIAVGARAVAGGRRAARPGYFFEPTLLTDVRPDMPVAAKEVFGPVASILGFSSEDEVVALANDTRAGLASYFFSRDIGRITRVAERLEYGMVGVNAGFLSGEMVPFGGVKDSGLGREGSRYGIDEYLNIKYVALAGIDS